MSQKNGQLYIMQNHPHDVVCRNDVVTQKILSCGIRGFRWVLVFKFDLEMVI